MSNLRIECVDNIWNLYISEIESTFDLSDKFKLWDKLIIQVEKEDISVEIVLVEKV